MSGIDEVIHFLFDDHDFDQDEIGRSLLSDTEVAAIGALKDALDRMIDLLPKGTDDDFVDHAGWPQVRRLAAEAGKLFDATD